jgi:hypothetical protein
MRLETVCTPAWSICALPVLIWEHLILLGCITVCCTFPCWQQIKPSLQYRLCPLASTVDIPVIVSIIAGRLFGCCWRLWVRHSHTVVCSQVPTVQWLHKSLSCVSNFSWSHLNVVLEVAGSILGQTCRVSWFPHIYARLKPRRTPRGTPWTV